ncbi:MAG: cytochrome c oxidase subunit II [Pseudomonadota bacterium]
MKIKILMVMALLISVAFVTVSYAQASSGPEVQSNAAAPSETLSADQAEGAESGAIVGAAKNWQMGPIEGVTPVSHEMNSFHHMLMWIVTAICIFVLALLLIVVFKFNSKKNPVPSKFTHNTKLEIVWTLVPVIILVFIIVPSMRLLYLTDQVADAEMTIVATGYQWYWGYEYPDHGGFSFNSYMIPDDEIQPGQKRLLETDNRVVVPVDTTVRLQVTAGDVLHSFAVPALGIKIDAIPHQLNETWFNIDKEGVYYGQCSELCGRDHAFMPITIEVVSKEEFEAWVENAREEFSDASDYTETQLAYLGEK